MKEGRGGVDYLWDIAKCCCQNELLNCCLRQQIRNSEFSFKLVMSFCLFFCSISPTCPFDMGGSKTKCGLLKLVWSPFLTEAFKLSLQFASNLSDASYISVFSIKYGYAWKPPAKVGRVDDVILWISCFSFHVKNKVLCAYAWYLCIWSVYQWAWLDENKF